jgi:ABC-2 type transport system permease protein
MRFVTILRTELTKMFCQRGTYAGYALLAVFTGLLVWGLWAEGPPMGRIGHQFGGGMAVGGKTVSASFVPYFLLQLPPAIDVFLPLIISMIAGGLIAGEAQRGTLRTVMVRPIHRWALMTGKIMASFIHTASAVLFMGAFSLLLGYIVFGRGDLVSFQGGLRIFPEPLALLKLAQAYGLATLTLCAVAAIGVFCSTIFEHPLTASGVTVGFLIVSATLQLIPYFEWLKPYLLTTHFHGFSKVFDRTVDWATIQVDLVYVFDYAAAAIAGAIVVFSRKDITC